jgi:hypothetical protein
VEAISKALSSLPSVSHVMLADNKIGESGAESIANHAWKSKSLRYSTHSKAISLFPFTLFGQMFYEIFWVLAVNNLFALILNILSKEHKDVHSQAKAIMVKESMAIHASKTSHSGTAHILHQYYFFPLHYLNTF